MTDDMTADMTAEEVVEQIFVQLNRRERAFTKALANHLTTEHRTLQQCFVRSVVSALKSYGSNAYTDARNKEAVKFAKKLKEMDPVFPFI